MEVANGSGGSMLRNICGNDIEVAYLNVNMRLWQFQNDWGALEWPYEVLRIWFNEEQKFSNMRPCLKVDEVDMIQRADEVSEDSDSKQTYALILPIGYISEDEKGKRSASPNGEAIFDTLLQQCFSKRSEIFAGQCEHEQMSDVAKILAISLSLLSMPITPIRAGCITIRFIGTDYGTVADESARRATRKGGKSERKSSTNKQAARFKTPTSGIGDQPAVKGELSKGTKEERDRHDIRFRCFYLYVVGDDSICMKNEGLKRGLQSVDSYDYLMIESAPDLYRCAVETRVEVDNESCEHATVIEEPKLSIYQQPQNIDPSHWRTISLKVPFLLTCGKTSRSVQPQDLYCSCDVDVVLGSGITHDNYKKGLLPITIGGTESGSVNKKNNNGVSASNDQKSVMMNDIFLKLPQADLRNLCSLLGQEGLSDKVYTLTGELLKKLASIAPSHWKFFIVELSDLACSLSSKAVQELITLRNTQMLGLSTGSMAGSSEHVTMWKLHVSLEPLRQELSECICVTDSQLGQGSLSSVAVNANAGDPPLPLGTQRLLPYDFSGYHPKQGCGKTPDNPFGLNNTWTYVSRKKANLEQVGYNMTMFGSN
ncbi:Armadillo [Artemisia annua]|uniref:Armadillo n=1 Tax=Artemisia annua TaxID=35608 RepID=A0A2U1M5V2_ARTAN|nr:Armadillo [Artemisia annua]